ncbi:MAG: HDOD domain-containing protein [Gammaproteobacteria bacterium]|nr:HDOD domain-containing protein [Gammaproteobacteria bacterium]MCW9031616.1 HDOD domain-containing protein [Gammaproteobacteria bacterium]
MVDLKELLVLNDFKKLDDAAMVDVAEHALIIDYAENERIVAEKMAGFTLYLLKGELDVQATGGIQTLMFSDDERAQSPIFYSDTPGHYGRCLSACKVLQIENSCITNYGLNHDRFKTDINYADFETLMGNTSLVLFDQITELFKSKSITLPSLPEIAMYINTALEKEDVSTKKFSKIIQMDPVIAARVVQVANSPLYGDTQSDSIQDALARIGIDGVRTIVMGVVLRDLFMPNNQLVIDSMTRFYEHSIRTGVVCYALAKKLPGFNRDQAFMAGILHDIGVVPILVVADRHPQIAEKANTLTAVLTHLKSYIGGMVLQQWDFADKFVEVAKHAYDWNRKVEKADYCDLVQVALMHSHLVGGEKIKGPELSELPAFKRLGFDKLNPVDNIQTLKELSLRIKDMIRVICK